MVGNQLCLLLFHLQNVIFNSVHGYEGKEISLNLQMPDSGQMSLSSNKTEAYLLLATLSGVPGFPVSF